MLLNLDERPHEWLSLSPYTKDKSHAYALGSTAQLLDQIRSEGVESSPVPLTRTTYQVQAQEKASHAKEINAELNRQKSQWNPHKDPNVTGDPSSTLFLARLPYTATSDQVKAQFLKFGPIDSVRIIEPRRGYAFVVFGLPNGPESVISAVQETTGGMLFQGRRIIVDFERGRLQVNWKPRRLGGGLGGRLSAARQRAEVARSHQIMRKGVRPPNFETSKTHPRREGDNLFRGRRSGPYDRPRDGAYPNRPQSHRFPKSRTDGNNNRTDNNRMNNRVDNRVDSRMDSRVDSRADSRGDGTNRGSANRAHQANQQGNPQGNQQGNRGGMHGRTLRQY